MGLGAHAVAARKLRQLERLAGFHLDRGFIRNGYAEMVVWTREACEHYEVWLNVDRIVRKIEKPIHFTSCQTRSVPANEACGVEH